MSSITIQIPDEVHKKLKIRAIVEETTAGRIAAVALAKALGYEPPPAKEKYQYVPLHLRVEDEEEEESEQIAQQVTTAESRGVVVAALEARKSRLTKNRIADDEPIGRRA